MIISGITGSSVADASAIGTIMIPAMIKEGYRKDFATGLVASATTVGVIIPPSIPFVIYGVITGASIGKLFMGGMVPGVLFSIFAMIISFFICRRQGGRRPQAIQLDRACCRKPVKVSGRCWRRSSFWAASSAECSPRPRRRLSACCTRLFVGFVIHKELTMKDMPQIILDSAATTAIVMLMVVGAFLYSWIITVDQVPQMVARVHSGHLHGTR